MHEQFHNLFGLDDSVIQDALGLPRGASENISKWLTDNCVNGKGNR